MIIEIKTAKLTHQDIGQLQMYVNYYDRYEKQDFENPTIGILMCTDKNDAVVKMAGRKVGQYSPLSSQYLEFYNQNIQYDDIKGFTGCEWAKELRIIEDFVSGVSKK